MTSAARCPRLPLAVLPVFLLLLFLLLLALAACAAAPISPEVLGQVNKEIGMARLVADPDAYVGEVVLLGGRIINVANLPEATEVEILQTPLENGQRPQGGDISEGRFLVRLSGYADPAIYVPGRLITVAGRVAGAEVRPVGQVEYRYPVLEALDVHLWQGRQQNGYPNVFFSIGVGTIF